MTQLAFSAACLTHSVPGALTSHIITLDLAAQPRLSYHLKHTLIRTAIRNGVVFEIPYAPVISPLDEHRRRNWWANAREVCRVTNGKNVIFGSGTNALADLRAPLDVANLYVAYFFFCTRFPYLLSTCSEGRYWVCHRTRR